MTDWAIGNNDPFGPVCIVLATTGTVYPSSPGGISSSNTTSAPEVASGVPFAYKPPKLTRKAEVLTPFQACAASRIWFKIDGSPSFDLTLCGPDVETRIVTVLLGSAVRSNF